MKDMPLAKFASQHIARSILSLLILGLLLLGLLLPMALPAFAQREEQTLSDGWKFLGGKAAEPPGIPLGPGRWKLSVNPTAEAADVVRPDFDDSAWSRVQPHVGDYSFAWFRTTLPADADSRPLLHFDSVNDNATVYLNGRKLLKHYGYTDPFDVPLGAAWKVGGPNVLVVLVENLTRSSGIGPTFLRSEEIPVPDVTDQWESVSVPHTWNAVDGQSGKPGYRRGPGWYERPLTVPPSWRGKRVFLRFEGASLVADVYVNGRHLGQHRGGFGAFSFEITPDLRFNGPNDLKVRVDNARRVDVAPLSGDFTVFGGLYRPVHLFATSAVCISPLDFATSGVYLTQETLSPQKALVEAKTLVSSSLNAPDTVRVETKIQDAAGKVVASYSSAAVLAPGSTQAVTQPFSITAPHLWQGRTDPYLYSVTVRLLRGDTLLDSVVQPLGLRTVAITDQDGFLLNGIPYPIHGVSRHQERQGKGWAISAADDAEDEQMILEMGATAVRLAHYPQQDDFYDLCDHSGLLLWTEIPQVNEIRLTPEFEANAKMQLREMILQHYNHPSAAFWGLFNELQGPYVTSAVPELTHLKAVAKALDNSRLIVSAATNGVYPVGHVPDWLGFNTYPGWYTSINPPDRLTRTIAAISKSFGKRIAISEYGAGGNPAQHEEGTLRHPNVGGQFHPEEWQTLIHQRDWQQLAHNPNLWGTFLWTMFDFAVADRHEGSLPGLNDKGMVTHDRKIKKDAFYFYKANWNPAPMVFIASRRMTPRTQADTEVQVFSNFPKVELRVNGQSQGTMKPDDVHVFRWKRVRLQPGVNHIEAIGRVEGLEVKDECDWVLQSDASGDNSPRPKE